MWPLRTFLIFCAIFFLVALPLSCFIGWEKAENVGAMVAWGVLLGVILVPIGLLVLFYIVIVVASPFTWLYNKIRKKKKEEPDLLHRREDK